MSAVAPDRKKQRKRTRGADRSCLPSPFADGDPIKALSASPSSFNV
jgi:hypothetical protein